MAKRKITFPETKIQTDIVQYLQMMKIYCIHIPNERKTTPQAMGRLIAMGLKAGVADLEVWYPKHGVDRVKLYQSMAKGEGLFINSVNIGYIEVKAPNGKQSDKQKKFEQRCKVAGIRYDLAYSVEDVKRILKEVI